MQPCSIAQCSEVIHAVDDSASLFIPHCIFHSNQLAVEQYGFCYEQEKSQFFEPRGKGLSGDRQVRPT